MNNSDEIQSSFAGRLERLRLQHDQRLQADLEALRQQMRGLLHNAGLPPEALAGAARAGLPPRGAPLTGLLSLGGYAPLNELEAAFLQAFELARYFPANRLAYPTSYCETLAEFYSPLAALEDLSPQARQAHLEQMAAEAERLASETHGGGAFGYNLPGQGCYLNGWLFAWGSDLTPRQAFEQPALLRRILQTAAHEKLGHGFLAAYSALGSVKSSLGLNQVEIARRFGLRPADDPLSSLRARQSFLLFNASRLLEEGWATWIETYLAAAVIDGNAEGSPRYTLAALLQALAALPAELPERQALQETLQAALAILFGEHELPVEALFQAAKVIGVCDARLEELFGMLLGQPLRYVVGELLFAQAVANQGALCAPYTALLAANVTFDLERLGLNDLALLLESYLRLHPDARLAALSRLRLEQPNSLPELVARAQAELSFTVPPEIKKG